MQLPTLRSRQRNQRKRTKTVFRTYLKKLACLTPIGLVRIFFHFNYFQFPINYTLSRLGPDLSGTLMVWVLLGGHIPPTLAVKLCASIFRAVGIWKCLKTDRLTYRTLGVKSFFFTRIHFEWRWHWLHIKTIVESHTITGCKHRVRVRTVSLLACHHYNIRRRFMTFQSGGVQLLQ